MEFSFIVDLIPMILKSFGFLMLSPFFWVIVFLIAMQYRRIAGHKERLFGVKDETVWQQVTVAIIYGVLGGVIGALLMILGGITITNIGIGYLWAVAILLLLISPRFLCFSYAGSIISLSYLLFGWPQIEVAHLMGLVAILHLVESFLIVANGHLGAMPVYTKNHKGETVGAFTLQKFWPIPIVALMVVTGVPAGETVPMPDWWPLIKSFEPINPEKSYYAMLPVIAALGYGDIAMTMNPQQKSYHTAALLSVYSIILFILAIIASHYAYLAVLPALFGALGHELTIYLGKRNQMQGKPLYVASQIGVRLLDVVKGSPAMKMGIRSGDIILSINNMRIDNRYHLAALLQTIYNFVEIEYVKSTDNRIYRETLWIKPGKSLGIIPVPEPTDSAQVTLSAKGMLARFIQNIVKKFNKGDKPGW
ncbi:PDZ domain-containing protein [Desulfitibacter alkalitolerans]|uniref:PDZ domain-containing protein n=1 Tax=Desulfitibacter alkalitolerans TaxID=264641 RepID=UPI000685BC07|nr:PDZ domain-containing protein [Desulfitibacter alkalitolerans]